MTERYLVSVDGAQAPSVEHSNLEDAKREAERLARLPSNCKRKVRVLMEVMSLAPMQLPTHAWEIPTPANISTQPEF